jgi:integrase
MKRRREKGEGSIRRRGSVWYARVTLRDGRRREVRLEAESRNEALTCLAKLKLKPPSASRVTVRALYEAVCDDYRLKGQDVETLGKRWLHLEPAFGSDFADEVDAGRIRTYAVARKDEGAAPDTVRNELACLRRMFRLHTESDPSFFVPKVPTIRVSAIRTGFFEREDFERVRAELPDYLHPVVTLAYWMGWRIGEVLSLQWRQLDLKTGEIRLDPGTTKNKDGRVAFLPEEPLEALRAWRETTTALERERARIVPHVFHNQGEPIRCFRTAWLNATKRAGVPTRLVHDFRRTAARNYVRAGVPERVAQTILGHKTRSIFDRYNIVAESDLREAAKRVVHPKQGADKGQIVPLAKGEKRVSS